MSRRPSRSRVGLLLALSVSLVAAIPHAHAAPLTDDERAIFLASPEDPAAAELRGVRDELAGQSFLVGNEHFLDRFEPAIKRLGGGYVGVGAEQGWLFIGWQRPTLAWLVDYDPQVVDIHRVHLAFFAAAPAYYQWRALWDDASDNAAREALAAQVPPAEVDALLAHYRAHRAKVRRRIDEMRIHFVTVGAKAFFSDARTYAWIHTFVREGRARPMVADLYGTNGLAGIGAAAKRLAVPIRVVYVSNAEQYADYDAFFVANVDHLRGDPKALLVRTVLTWQHNRDYRYVVQPLDRFAAWLAHPEIIRVSRMVGNPKDPLPLEPVLTRFDSPPPKVKKPRPAD
jgi:hypothetical protein